MCKTQKSKVVRKYFGVKKNSVSTEDLGAGGPGEKTRKNAFFLEVADMQIGAVTGKNLQNWRALFLEWSENILAQNLVVF